MFSHPAAGPEVLICYHANILRNAEVRSVVYSFPNIWVLDFCRLSRQRGRTSPGQRKKAEGRRCAVCCYLVPNWSLLYSASPAFFFPHSLSRGFVPCLWVQHRKPIRFYASALIGHMVAATIINSIPSPHWVLYFISSLMPFLRDKLSSLDKIGIAQPGRHSIPIGSGLHTCTLVGESENETNGVGDCHAVTNCSHDWHDDSLLVYKFACIQAGIPLTDFRWWFLPLIGND